MTVTPDRARRDDTAPSRPLPARAYHDPDVLARELERVFARSWSVAGLVSDVAAPGSYVTATCGMRDYVVMRGRSGDLRAFDNLCPVAGHRCLDGRGAAPSMLCADHGVALPGDAGSDGEGGWRVEIYAGLVFVTPAPGIMPAARMFAGLDGEIARAVPEIGDLVFAHRLTRTFRSNWKAMIDNSVECYHCPVAHPEFDGLLDLDSYRIANHAWHGSHTARHGTGANDAYGFSESDSLALAAWWLWPNTLMGPFPGRSNFTLHRIMPLSPETAVEHFDFYFLEATPDADEAEAIRFFRDTLRPQDVDLVESVQRGLHSRGYRQGCLIDDPVGSGSSERNIALFHSLLRQALG